MDVFYNFNFVWISYNQYVAQSMFVVHCFLVYLRLLNVWQTHFKLFQSNPQAHNSHSFHHRHRNRCRHHHNNYITCRPIISNNNNSNNNSSTNNNNNTSITNMWVCLSQTEGYILTTFIVFSPNFRLKFNISNYVQMYLHLHHIHRHIHTRTVLNTYALKRTLHQVFYYC